MRYICIHILISVSTIEKIKKNKKKSPESTSAPLNKQSRHERLAAPRPPNPKPSTSSGLHRTPSNPSSQERRPSTSSEFQWTAPNPSPKEKRRPPPIIYRSRDDSEAIPNVLSSEWINNEFKKRNLDSKPTAMARLKTL